MSLISTKYTLRMDELPSQCQENKLRRQVVTLEQDEDKKLLRTVQMPLQVAETLHQLLEAALQSKVANFAFSVEYVEGQPLIVEIL